MQMKKTLSSQQHRVAESYLHFKQISIRSNWIMISERRQSVNKLIIRGSRAHTTIRLEVRLELRGKSARRLLCKRRRMRTSGQGKEMQRAKLTEPN